jgi:hypothetical protein
MYYVTFAHFEFLSSPPSFTAVSGFAFSVEDMSVLSWPSSDENGHQKGSFG